MVYDARFRAAIVLYATVVFDRSEVANVDLTLESGPQGLRKVEAGGPRAPNARIPYSFGDTTNHVVPRNIVEVNGSDGVVVRGMTEVDDGRESLQ